ncbi:hypothetical protein HMI54_008721 [Coelomomyces lativittatus]|nr:hypothetical protein HMI56_003546 [Coelomomyces lativittatus]KAJ1502154.1 hypothetical protein HMI55_003034 [Coelomomyces lativittatus]KAJ1502738.1 hypothetical protein HMI54_008721 [Coelomomyces lativittatus]
MVNTKEEGILKKQTSPKKSSIMTNTKRNTPFTSKEPPYIIINKPKNPKGNRMRRKTNAQDKELLHSIYSRIKNPDSATRKDIAKTLGWPERSVRIWFQNMRQKDASRAKAGLLSFPLIPDQDAFNVVNEITAQHCLFKTQGVEEEEGDEEEEEDNEDDELEEEEKERERKMEKDLPLSTDFNLFLPPSILSTSSPHVQTTHPLYPWPPLPSSHHPLFTPHLHEHITSTPYLVNPRDLHPCLPPPPLPPLPSSSSTSSSSYLPLPLSLSTSTPTMSHECEFMMNAFLNPTFTCTDTASST